MQVVNEMPPSLSYRPLVTRTSQRAEQLCAKKAERKSSPSAGRGSGSSSSPSRSRVWYRHTFARSLQMEWSWTGLDRTG